MMQSRAKKTKAKQKFEVKEKVKKSEQSDKGMKSKICKGNQKM